MDPDLELLVQWKQGNKQAGNQLYAKYYDRIALFFNNSVGERDRLDLTQETFARLTEAVERFEGRAQFKSFIYAIARNVLNSHLRARYRGKGDFDPIEHTLQDTGCLTPSRAVSELSRYRALLDCLHKVPVEYKTMLELYHWSDMTAEELAEIYGKNASTIRGRVLSTKRSLMQCVAKHQARPIQDVEATLDQDLERIGELLSSGPSQPTRDEK